eukprot:scaffold18861_cov26-Tisochrysis_lutea.AAC.2
MAHVPVQVELNQGGDAPTRAHVRGGSGGVGRKTGGGHGWQGEGLGGGCERDKGDSAGVTHSFGSSSESEAACRSAGGSMWRGAEAA